jgi:hypothetical protein
MEKFLVNRLLRFCLAVSLMVTLFPRATEAQDGAAAAPSGAPAPYETFVKGAVVSPGLIPVVRKGGKVYLVIATSQLGKDFIETSVPSTGLGGFGPAAGEPYVAPARIMRFERVDDNVVIRWPNTFAKVDQQTPQALAVQSSLPGSVVALAPVVAQSSTVVVISAAPFLGDLADLHAQFDAVAAKPGHSYRLDSTRSFFADAKSFPDNTLLRVSQTWSTDSPDTIDNVPDPRSIEVRMTYNIIAAPQDGYMPRIADPRVGYFEQPLIDFSTDRKLVRNVYYVVRWNFMPEHPGQPSVAKRPLIFTLNNNIPVDYRDVVKQSLLQWNAAFERIGILNAVQVQQQPDDPSFDVDDIRHNMVSWIDATSPQYGAEALIISDPRTGEELNSGVNVDAVAGLVGRGYRYYVAPVRGLPSNEALERKFTIDWIHSVVLHEVGHDFGLQHNFIGSMAYTGKQLQDSAFTAKYGVASSVMEYAPANVWPKGTPQGDLFQLVLGPYDYYAIQYGYANIANAATPDDEVATLNRFASRWSDPMYRFASDEDAAFDRGHAIDPRVQQNDLTDHPLSWETMQLRMLHGVMNAVDQRFPRPGDPYEEARRAFAYPLRLYVLFGVMPAHIIGGEYISRANAGDPHSAPPLQPVSRSDEYQAWSALETYLFADDAWRFSPNVLNKLVYSEVSTFSDGSWIYTPTPRHDVAVVQVAAQAQDRVLNELFAPLTLQRIDELSTKYAPGTTMTLTDLFDWTRAGIFSDLQNGTISGAGVVRRNAQVRFAKRLAQLWIAPVVGTPTDAQALARLQLRYLEQASAHALNGKLDELTRSHVEALQAIAKQGLEARPAIAAPAPPPAAGP